MTNIPSEPDNFTTNSAFLDTNKPVWGTCPSSPTTTTSIYLDPNGITIKCPGANIGDKATISGKEYIVVDEQTLRNKVDNNEDVTCVCTSKVTDMKICFSKRKLLTKILALGILQT